MDIQLYVNSKTVDLNDDVEIRLMKEFQDSESLVVEDVSYSYEMELPITATNKAIFSFTDTDSVSGKFNRVYDAQLVAGGLLILNGKLIINEIDFENYKGNLYVPAKKELSDVLGDRTLKELIPHYKPVNSFGDIDKINAYVGGLEGALPAEQYRDNHVCFPYVLYSWPYNKAGETNDRYLQLNDYSKTTFDLNNMFPAFNVLSVLKDIFATNGYTLQGNVFSNQKLSGLYQTYSESADLWKQEKNTPYFLSFSCNYSLCKYIQEISANNLSDTAEEFDDENFRFWADNPVWSSNTTFTSVNDKYNMMKKVYNENYQRDKRVIVIPVSGWYQISSTGTITLPDETRLTQFTNMNIAGWKTRYDNTSFSQSSWEFQIKKGVPKENVNHYGYNFGLPLAPVDYIQNEDNLSVVWYGLIPFPGVTPLPTCVKVMGSENSRRYGKNGKTTIVKNYSGFDTSDFLLGARFGHQALLYSKKMKYRRNAHNAFKSLYDVSKAPQIWTKSDAFTAMFPEVTDNYLYLHDYENENNNTYGYRTAQAMVSDEGMFNFDGYNILKATGSGNSTIYSWDTTSNTGERTYPGQLNNTVTASNATNGTWNINNCVWLEEGDTVYTEFLGAYINDDSDKKCGCTNASLDFTMSIGLVSTNKDWKPTVDDPIRTGEGLQSAKVTDMNQFLPNIKCNEYLKNFLSTFNCKLTAVDETTYSLDFKDAAPERTNTVDIDEYCHTTDAVYKRISLPSSIAYKFKVDTNEEGYVHGNDSPYEGQPQWSYNQPKHTGELLLVNPSNTSGSEKKTESQWSYTWLKTMKDSTGKIFPAPVIADAALFGESYDYELAQKEALKTEKTMRLFYIYNEQDVINGGTLIPRENFIKITGEHTFRLLIADSGLWSYARKNGLNYYGWKTSFLDYDNSYMNTLGGRDKTITDNFIDTDINFNRYQVEISCILPVYIYDAITKGSMVMFNDGLWRIESIDGFDPAEKEPATITLVSLD